MWRQMKKKLIIISVLLVCVMLFTLVGCGSEKSGLEQFDNLIKKNKNPITLSIWTYYNNYQQQAFQGLIKEFNESIGLEKNIIIEGRYLGSVGELAKKLDDAAGKKVGEVPMPEMFITYSDDCLSLDNKYQNIASLDKYFTEDEINGFNKEFLNEGYYDGQNLKIIPTAKSTEILMLNKTDWDKFATKYNAKNPNSPVSLSDFNTMEGLFSASKKYKETTNKTLFGWDSMANYMLANSSSLGSEIVQGGKVSSDKSVYKKLFDNFFAAYLNQYYGAFKRFRSDDIKSGDILGCICSSTGGNYFPSKIQKNAEESYDIESYVTTVPVFSGGTKLAVQQGAGIAISKSTELKEYACAIFLKWLTQKEQSIDFASKSGYLPTTKSSLQKELIINSIAGKSINERKAMEVALQTAEEYKFYFAKPYTNSNKVREVLDNVIYYKEKGQRPAYMSNFINAEQALIEINAETNPQTKAELLQYYMSEEYFEIWYNELCQILKAVIQL